MPQEITAATASATASLDAGFDDLRPAHLAVFQYPGPNGRRPSELARDAGTTKQAIGHLLDQLVALGYVRRCENERDPRVVTLALTSRGEAAIRVIRVTVRRIQAEWAKMLGPRRFDELRALLIELNRALFAQRRSLSDRRPTP